MAVVKPDKGYPLAPAHLEVLGVREVVALGPELGGHVRSAHGEPGVPVVL